MVFSSTLFLCIFLPTVLILHTVLPPRVRNIWLLLASLLFYAWGEPRYIVILFFTALLDYAAGLILPRISASGAKKAALAAVTALNIGALCFFKYTNFLLSDINGLLGTQIPLLELALPVGISFYTFQSLSYVIDVYRGRVAPQRNFIDFFMFVTLFPQLVAGPIVRYCEIESELRVRRIDSADFADGVCRFCVGLGKKVLLANTMGEFYKSATGQPMTVVLAWCASIAYMFQIYFDFSGYSDMAIGMGKMLGFRFPENFRYPYEADSITDFWRRWHITLSSWFREYLYIPLGGNRRGLPRQIFNLFVVWACTGLWHGGQWNFLFWGLYFFVLLTLEKLFLGRLLERMPAFLRHLYTLILVFFSWVLFAGDSTGRLAAMLRALFGVGVDFSSGVSVFYLLSYLLLFVICAAASTHYPAALAKKLAGRIGSADVRLICRGLLCFAVLLLSLAFLVGDSFNPFLYFRF